MKTLPAQFLMRSNWLIAAMSIGLVCLVLSSAVAHAQAPTTCADQQWPTGKGIQPHLPWNSPGAGKPTVVDLLASKAEAAQKTARLTCDAKPLQSWPASPQSNALSQRVAAALKAGTPGTNVLAQAIYVADVFPLKAGAQGANKPSDVWRTEQAQTWCAQQPSTADPEKLIIPANLPTLGEAVQQLNLRAIALSWQVLGGLPVDQRKDDWRAAVKWFVLNGAKA
jgi:hypothetical protein